VDVKENEAAVRKIADLLKRETSTWPSIAQLIDQLRRMGALDEAQRATESLVRPKSSRRLIEAVTGRNRASPAGREIRL